MHIPALSLSDGYNAWILAGWQIPFVLLGLVLVQQGAVPARRAAATV